MKQQKILIIEDHLNINEEIGKFLIQEGFQVLSALNLKDAAILLNEIPDLIILDWNLPDGQGIDFLKKIRADDLTMPVIFLTARVDLIDKVLGLEVGADDYMTKPFESRELVARVRVRLRSTKSPSNTFKELSSEYLEVGPLLIDKVKHLVKFNNIAIELVRKEFDLLVLLAENPEKVFSRDEILNKVWGYDVFPTTRTVDTHIMQLRQKLNEDLIETVRAVGYRLKKL
ncbi:MAG: response regulator transcription factor [Pseudobdellovibrionaceae bacterium]